MSWPERRISHPSGCVVTFSETAIAGVIAIETEVHRDERGTFATTFSRRALARQGVAFEAVQANVSRSLVKGTLRGLHYQEQPHAQAKLVRCVRGVIFDVTVDLRRASASYCGWLGIELSEQNGRAVYIPAGCAHGFITLADDAEVEYLMDDYYEPSAERGVRWDDSQFGITWPVEPRRIAARDATHPDFQP